MDVGGAQSAYRVLDILSEVAIHHDGVSASEVSRSLGLTLPTTHRLLRVLCDRKFVSQDFSGGRYRVGAQLSWITGSGIGHEELIETARPYLNQLQEACGETVFLSVRDGLKATYLECLPSSRSIRLYGAPGMPVPLHASSQGKVILAFQPQTIRSRLIDKLDLRPYTANTVVLKEKLIAAIEEARENGFALNLEEHEVGTYSVSAPVIDTFGNAVAAVCVGGPKFRVTEEDLRGKFAQLVMSCCSQISGQLAMRSKAG